MTIGRSIRGVSDETWHALRLAAVRRRVTLQELVAQIFQQWLVEQEEEEE